MEALPLAVRRRIVELFQTGLEGDDVAEIMACSPAAARRVWQRYREDGVIEPRPHGGGHTPRLTDERKKQILGELVAQKPDAFCRELADDLHARTGVRVCRQTVGAWLAALGLTRKKSRCVPPSRGGRTSGRNGTPGPRRSSTPAAATSPASASSTRAGR
jgi:transposase